MQAVVLAAGKSSRFEPLTNLAHKSMVNILGRPILWHTLVSLKKSHITDVVIVVSEESQIPQIIGDGKDLGLTITYITHVGAKGMGAALLDAKEYLHERFFLLSAYHIDIEKFADEMKKVDDQKVVLLAKTPQGSTEFGVIEIDGEKVTGVVEKPQKILDHQLQIIGIYLLNQDFLQILQQTPLEHYHFEKALDAYARKGKVTFFKTSQETLSLKYTWDLLQLKNYLLAGVVSSVASSANVSDHAVLSGNICIDEGAHIMEGAVIKGPAYIGKNVTIGNDAILRNGVDIEERVVIGARMELKNSLVLEHTTTHSGFIGDSIIGPNTKIAAYICTANARLDRTPVTTIVKEEKVNSGLKHLGVIIGERANIGIRVSTMPGVIIGNESIVGPSTTVMKNIAPQKKYYTKFSEVVEDAK